MKDTWIENYNGTWQDAEGRRLIIKSHDDENATVDLLIHGTPMVRPWCEDRPAKGMHAKYNPVEGPGLDVELGRPGFELNLNYEYMDPMNPNAPEELSVSISSYQSDNEAEQFIEMFGKLGRYRSSDAEPVA
jgi:hypothetical protein